MASLQNIPTISEEKRKKRKAPSKRKTSVLKEITMDEWSKIHQTFINISTGKALLYVIFRITNTPIV